MKWKKEKLQWLTAIGAKEFPEPIKYAYTFPGYSGTFNLSERYIEETNLDELKAQYGLYICMNSNSEKFLEYTGICCEDICEDGEEM